MHLSVNCFYISVLIHQSNQEISQPSGVTETFVINPVNSLIIQKKVANFYASYLLFQNINPGLFVHSSQYYQVSIIDTFG